MLSSLFISKTSQNSLKVTTSKESSHPNEQNALVLYNRDLSFDSRSNAFQTLLKWLTENPLKFGAEVSDMLRNAVENNVSSNRNNFNNLSFRIIILIVSPPVLTPDKLPMGGSLQKDQFNRHNL